MADASARPVRGPVRPEIGVVLIAWLALALWAAAGQAMTPPGTLITNTAQADWIAPGGPVVTGSNAIDIVVSSVRTPSATEILHYAPANPMSAATAIGPEQCSTSGTAAGPFVPSPPPTTLGGAPINLGAPVDLLIGGAFHRGEPVFLRVTDPDQDLDAAIAETVLVTVSSAPTGDTEVLRLTETGPSTGTFVGVLMTTPPPPVPGDCALSVVPADSIDVLYVDAADGTDSSSSAALVDPRGVVFDSQTAARIDGAIVRLVDAGSGLPANVFGDDGVSIFPSALVSGGTATDSGGTAYAFGPGEFRFPFVAAGTYRLEVSPPAGRAFPSVVPDATLQTLPGSPYSLGAGSRGAAFTVPLGPAIEVDIPLDPTSGGTGLLVAKQASRTNARIGEFVQYVVTVGTPAVGVPGPVTLTDRLPAGFRFEPDSLKIDGASAPDPAVGAGGRTLTIPLGVVDPGRTIEVRYVALVGAAARPGSAHNDVTATGFGMRSNTARATVRVAADILEDRTILVGRVRIGSCTTPLHEPHPGVAGVRLFLEDGTYVVTDEVGRFHMTALSAGTHVLQIDLDTLPEGLRLVDCGGHAGAGQPGSQFVEQQAGGVWRTDFLLEADVPPVQELRQRLSVSPRGAQSRLELDVSAAGSAYEDVAAVVMLPPGVRVVSGSARVGGHAAATDSREGAVTFRMPTLARGETRRVAFSLERTETDPAAKRVAKAIVQARHAGQPVRTPVAEVAFCGGCVAASAEQAVALEAAPPAEGAAEAEPEAAPAPARPEDAFDGAWLAKADPATRWLYPAEGFNPAISAIKVGIQHPPRYRVRLSVNGAPVSPLNFDGRTRNRDGTTAISRWRGVDVREGPNALVALIVDDEGQVVERLARQVFFSGPPVRAEFVREASHLVADGRTSPVLAIRFFDRHGRPARAGTTGTFQVDPPYQTREEVAAMRTQAITDVVGGDFGLGSSSYVVGSDGIAKVPLQPTAVVGEVRFQVALGGVQTESLEAWLEPGEREWVLVGLGTGTAGLNVAHGDEANRRAVDVEDGNFTEGRLAFFAKGSVLGKWLLTAAYDTDAERTRLGELGGESGLGDRLLGVIDPEEHYTLYGDRTEQGTDAATSNRLYLKIEHERFFVLYGDYETGLDQTELGRYQRTLTGLKTARRGETVSWNAFATDTEQQFLKDEIRGRGVSGLYSLRTGDIIVGSEQVQVEVRDRFQGQRIVSTVNLTRNIDYDIDYAAGTIHFREPVGARDEHLNPIFIVVDYEVDGRGRKEVTGGGRVAATFAEGAVEVGATAIHQGGGDLDAELMAVDATLQLGERTRVQAEYGRTTQENFRAPSDRNEAWLVKAEHRGETLEATAYAERQDGGFGLGQQRGSSGATRSIGIDARVHVNEDLRVDGKLFRDENLANGDERAVAEGRVEWDDGRRGAHAGVRAVADRGRDEGGETVQLLLGGHQGFLDDRFTLRASTELGFGDEGAHGDYSDRLLLGADWRLTEKVTVFGEQEFTFGELRSTQDSRFGMRATPWTGGSIETDVTDRTTENGRRTFANLGIGHLWQILPAWSADLRVERSQTLRSSETPFDPDVPPAGGTRDGTGESDFTAFSVGTGYSKEGVSVSARAETRYGDAEDQWNLLLGALKESGDTGYSARLEFFRTESDDGEIESRADGRFGTVFRPLDGPFILLEQLDVEWENRQGGGFDFQSRRLINHAKLDHQWDRRTQISWQLSTKWVVDTIDDQRFSSFGNVLGVELRRDIGERWDLALHARARHLAGGRGHGVSWNYGVSVGRVLMRNVWLSLGYNFSGYTDSEFSRSEFTARGPFVRVRVKADQETVRGLLGWSGGRPAPAPRPGDPAASRP